MTITNLNHRFIDSVLHEASPGDRSRFLDGIKWMDARSQMLFGRNFVSAGPSRQTELLERIAASDDREDRAETAFFQTVKSMTVVGYYTSEVGLAQELGDDGHLRLKEFAGCTHPEHLA